MALLKEIEPSFEQGVTSFHLSEIIGLVQNDNHQFNFIRNNA